MAMWRCGNPRSSRSMAAGAPGVRFFPRAQAAVALRKAWLAFFHDTAFMKAFT